METNEAIIEPGTAGHQPWNKSKLIGQKPPLQPKHVWAIRSRLQPVVLLDHGCYESPLRIAPDGFAIAFAEGANKPTFRTVGSANGLSFQGQDVSRSNIIYLLIGALVVVVIVLGYQLYQRQNQGVQINIGPGGASIDAR